LNWAGWIAAVCGAAAVAALWLRTIAARWNSRTLAGLRAASRTVNTRRGEIEYATSPTGSPILISHGTLGGFDQGVVAAELILTPQFRPIAVSRPGYLRTALAVGATPEQQADAFAALLDSLAIDRLPIIGISGGGPPALQFALRHPQRCTAIVLICAVTQRLTLPRRAMFAARFPRVATSNTANWFVSLLYRRFPAPIAQQAFTPYERSSSVSAADRCDALRLMGTSVPVKPRFEGVMNDASYLSTLDSYPLERITQPTLIIHGDSDEVVPFAHAQLAAGKIPGARLIAQEHGSHFASFVRSSDTRAAIQEFLNRQKG
jgi:pimeloyl-ACP methyl ester carboxylesterase